MRTFGILTVVGLGLIGAIAPVQAQYYDGRDPGYRDRGYGDRSYGGRGRDRDDDDDRDYRRRDRGDRYDGRRAGFDEDEYLRCNPDVRRAVNRGTMESGATHYRIFGRKEGRRLSC